MKAPIDPLCKVCDDTGSLPSQYQSKPCPYCNPRKASS